MDQYGFRQGVNQIWIGVGIVIAWIIALVVGTIVCLTYLDGTRPSKAPMGFFWFD